MPPSLPYFSSFLRPFFAHSEPQFPTPVSQVRSRIQNEHNARQRQKIQERTQRREQPVISLVLNRQDPENLSCQRKQKRQYAGKAKARFRRPAVAVGKENDSPQRSQTDDPEDHRHDAPVGMPFVGKNIAFSFLHKNSKRALPLRSRPPREMPIICS